MKKLIILTTILISIFFSNMVFADIIIPWQNCYDYDKKCYKKCIITLDFTGTVHFEEKWRCIDECCIKEKIQCEKPFYAWYYEFKGEPYPLYKQILTWDCTKYWKIIQFLWRHPNLMNIIILIFAFFILIFYKRKKW